MTTHPTPSHTAAPSTPSPAIPLATAPIWAIGYAYSATDGPHVLEAQTAHVKSAAAGLGWTLIDVLGDTRGRRRELWRALSMLENGAAEALIVDSLDRLGRAPEHLRPVVATLAGTSTLLHICSWGKPVRSSDLPRNARYRAEAAIAAAEVDSLRKRREWARAVRLTAAPKPPGAATKPV